MQLSIVGRWIAKWPGTDAPGVSPYTGEPVRATGRLAKPNSICVTYDGITMCWQNPDTGRASPTWETDKTYAVQPGRGQKAVGRVKLLAIERWDVRDMTADMAREAGFSIVAGYWYEWCKMHDPAGYRTYFDEWHKQNGLALIRHLNQRPAERYQAWWLRFEPVEQEG